jgi:hypothetical protein
MKKLGYAFVAMLAAGAMTAAQDLERKTQTKISVEDGKTITVTGCVHRNSDGGFTLTNVAGKDGALGSYLLANDEDDLDKHVGHRVEITGKAADLGKAKVTVRTKNETKVGDGDKSKTESKSELKGDLPELPYLGVKSMRMIASVCP